jgi:hypothetical protein
MIINLSETRKRQTELRAYLIKTIGERIEDVFGLSRSVEDPLRKITRIEFDPLQLSI